MRYDSVKRIALYYRNIPGMLRLLKQERAELEEEYNGLRGMEMDGMPHGSSPGKPTEALGMRCMENGVGDRIAEIESREKILTADAATIRACLDALNGRYKQVIVLRYVRGYSWAKIGMRINAPDSTARCWHEKAMKRFGEVLEELTDVGALTIRASRART